MTASAYRLVRTRIDTLLRPLPAGDAERVVPGCPQWTVRETLSHLVGACSDILAGRRDGAGSPEWTAAQVSARQGEPVGKLLDEWATTGDQVAAALEGRSALGQVVMDAVSHEYDLRNALGAPLPKDDAALDVALDWLLPRFGRYLDALGVPSLRLVLLPDGAERLLGSSQPVGSLRATRLDTLRTFTGRRSLAQARALDWDSPALDDDPAPWVAALAWGPFGPPAAAVEPPPAGH